MFSYVVEMPITKPMYTVKNTTFAYRLYWSVTVHWHKDPLPEERWLNSLVSRLDKDGIRVYSHRFEGGKNSQFLISTTPATDPSEILRLLKGRLQYEIRHIYPKGLKRNYSIQSVGSANAHVINGYVASQLNHHRMADPRVQSMLSKWQYANRSIDLTKPASVPMAAMSTISIWFMLTKVATPRFPKDIYDKDRWPLLRWLKSTLTF